MGLTKQFNCIAGIFLLISYGLSVLATVVPSPPRIIKQPPAEGQLFQVAVGPDDQEKPFVLDCEATGEPLPTYEWTKNGLKFDWQAYDDRISQQPGRGTLVVTSPTHDDEGYYQCLAINEHGTALSNGVFVRKSEFDYSYIEWIEMKTVVEGEPLTLECRPLTGNPKPTISWVIQTKAGAVRSINSSRITVDPEGQLHFSIVTKEDGLDDAYYVCSASIAFLNKYKLGSKVELTVTPAGDPSVQMRGPQKQYVSPSNMVAQRGQALDIFCIFSGSPLPEIQWKKHGSELPTGRYTTTNYGKTLKLKKVDFEDEGTYECTASNGVSSVESWSVTVTVQAVPYWISEPDDTAVAEEEDLTFECKASGVPEPEIRWFMNGVELEKAPPNPRRKLVSPKVLKIDQVVKSDTAVFQCNASNALGYVFKNFYLNVLVPPSPPTIIKQPPAERQFVQVEDKPFVFKPPLVLDCEARGEPMPTYEWTKNGLKFDWQANEDRISQQPGRGTLVVTSPTHDDEGYYQCLAINEHGTALSNIVFVEKSEFGSFDDERIEKKTVREGEPLTLECHPPTGYPKPTIFWIIQTKAGSSRSINSSRITVDPEGKLHFSNVTKEDGLDDAYYTCAATIALLNKLKFGNKFELTVVSAGDPSVQMRGPEKQYVSPQNMVAQRGQALDIFCIFGGSPLPEIQWKKHGSELPPGRYTTTNYGKTLKLKKVDFEDEGTYECTASNGVSSVESWSVTVTVQAVPYWISEPEDTTAAEEEDVTFECKASGVPEPEIRWFMNGVELEKAPPNPRRKLISPTVLKIDQVVKSDTAVYQCNASNALGYVFKNFYVNFLDVPDPPKLVGVECNRFTARIEWLPMGDNRAPILGYFFHRNISFQDAWHESIDFVPVSQLKFEVPMSPWVNYSFRVSARNEIGHGFPSDYSQLCQTPPDVPYKNPENVTGKGSSPDNLVISWTMMPPIEQNAPGFYYRVFYRLNVPGNAWEPPVDISDWQTSQYVVKNQPTFKEYVIKVEAHNSMGQANVAATEVIGYSGEDVPLEAPPKLYLLGIVNGNTALITWDPVDPDSVRGHVKGYKIQAWTTKESPLQMREMIVPANVTKTLVTMLVPYSKNIVHVLVFNDAHDGPPSDSLSFFTPAETPGPVASFDAVPMGSTALYLMWERPDQPNGFINGYRIYYEKVEGTKLGQMKERVPPVTNPVATRAKLGHLEPETKYRISIRATTSKGPGDSSSTEISTGSAVAARPDKPNFTWELLPVEDKKAEIKVTWLPNIDGVAGSHFYVQYRIKGTAQWVQTDHELNEDNVIISWLEAGTVYELRVVAVDGEYESMSDPQEIKTTDLKYL